MSARGTEIRDYATRTASELPSHWQAAVGVLSQCDRHSLCSRRDPLSSYSGSTCRTFLRHFKMFQFIYQQCKAGSSCKGRAGRGSVCCCCQDLRIRTIESRVTARALVLESLARCPTERSCFALSPGSETCATPHGLRAQSARGGSSSPHFLPLASGKMTGAPAPRVPTLRGRRDSRHA